MAKQQPKQQPSQPKKQGASSGTGSFSYLWRNLLVGAVIGIIFLIFDGINAGPARMQELYREYMQLQQARSNNNTRMGEIQQEFAQLQGDTGSIKQAIRKYTAGYYWAAHDIAIGGKNDVQEKEEKAGKPLTREDKLAMRVSLWPLIDHINKNTPANAVIYLPEGDSAISNTNYWNYVYDPEWMEYFLYPRLCVTIGSEDDHPDLVMRATHVVIIEGKGYDKLKYEVPVEQRVREAVLPIDHPPVQNQQ